MSKSTYRISGNVVKESSILGIPLRNWIEGAVFALIVFWIIQQIPFTTTVKNIFRVIYCGAVFIGGLIGIKNRAVTEFLVDEIKFLKNRRRLHLRGPEYERNKKEYKHYEVGHSSIARRKFDEAMARLRQVAGETGEEEGR